MPDGKSILPVLEAKRSSHVLLPDREYGDRPVAFR